MGDERYGHAVMLMGVSAFGKNRTLSRLASWEASRWLSSKPADLAEEYVFEHGRRVHEHGHMPMPMMLFWSISSGGGDSDLDAPLSRVHETVQSYADEVSAVFFRCFQGPMRSWISGEVDAVVYPPHSILPLALPEGRRGKIAILVEGVDEGSMPVPTAWAIRGSGSHTRRRHALAEFYERRLEKTQRVVAADVLERELAAAAERRSIAAVLMDDDWFGLHCLMAVAESHTLAASAVAKVVDRSPDDVAPVLANLVRQDLLHACGGAFKCTQLGTFIQSKVAALTNA